MLKKPAVSQTALSPYPKHDTSHLPPLVHFQPCGSSEKWLFAFDLWGLFSRNFQEAYDYCFCSTPTWGKVQWRDAMLSARCSASSMLDVPVLLKADNSRLLPSLSVSFQMAFSFLDTDTVWASSHLSKREKTVWRKFGFLQLESTMTPLRAMTLIDLAFKKWKLLEDEIH